MTVNTHIFFLALQLIDVKLGLSKTNLRIKELFTLQLVFFDLVCVLINFFYYRNTLFSHGGLGASEKKKKTRGSGEPVSLTRHK